MALPGSGDQALLQAFDDPTDAFKVKNVGDTAVTGALTDAELRATPVPVDINGDTEAGTVTHTADNNVTNAAEDVIAVNAAGKRVKAIIQVVSGGNARVCVGVDAAANKGVQLIAGGTPLTLEGPWCPQARVSAIREGTVDSVIAVAEVTRP